jgi:methylisocitrate lyase
MLSAGQRICSVTDLPVIVDADTGYGNAINVIRTVDELIRIGAGGMFLEDQVWLSDVGTCKASRSFHSKSNLKQALGLNEAITRGMAFKQAGADAVFIEAPETREEMLDIARCVPGPLVANMLERGVTPLMGPQELRDWALIWSFGLSRRFIRWESRQ